MTLRTEAMAFLTSSFKAPDRLQATDQPPLALTSFAPLLSPFGAVQWVHRYRYLGHDLRWNLSTDGLVAQRVEHLNRLLLTHVNFNRTVRGMGVCGQLQLLATRIQGSVNYLFSTVTFTKADFKSWTHVS